MTAKSRSGRFYRWWPAWPLGGPKWLPQLVGAATDLLLPPICNFCGSQLQAPGRQPLLCDECRERFLQSAGPVCPRCAAPVQPLLAGAPDCVRCRHRRYAFESARALGVYRDRLREAVIRMKQRVHEPLTLSMGYLLAEAVAQPPAGDRPDVLVPMPTHWLKRLRRGVNGPDVLVEALAATSGLPAWRRLLFCRRQTRKQGTLLPAERRRNVRGAFGVTRGYDLGRAHVMLVDDILTTGATANEAARTLRQAGVRRVSLLVVARGVGLDQRQPR